MKLKIEPEIRFAVGLSGENSKYVFFTRMSSEKVRSKRSLKFNFMDTEIFQVGNNIYSIMPGNLAVTKYSRIYTE